MDNWNPEYLRRQVRIEKVRLIGEKREHVSRLTEIEKRLGELEKAENLLEGE